MGPFERRDIISKFPVSKVRMYWETWSFRVREESQHQYSASLFIEHRIAPELISTHARTKFPVLQNGGLENRTLWLRQATCHRQYWSWQYSIFVISTKFDSIWSTSASSLATDKVESDKQPGKYPVVYTNITFLGRKADVLGLSTMEIALFDSLLGSRNTSRSYQIHFLLQSEPVYIRGWGNCTLARNLPCVAVEDCYDW